LREFGLYVGSDDNACENVDSSCDVPEILVEASVGVAVVEVDDARDKE
jgi:hypothetical protein